MNDGQRPRPPHPAPPFRKACGLPCFPSEYSSFLFWGVMECHTLGPLEVAHRPRKELICIDLHLVYFFVITLPLLVVVIERVVPSLKFFHVPCLWPAIYLHSEIQKTEAVMLAGLAFRSRCQIVQMQHTSQSYRKGLESEHRGAKQRLCVQEVQNQSLPPGTTRSHPSLSRKLGVTPKCY